MNIYKYTAIIKLILVISFFATINGLCAENYNGNWVDIGIKSESFAGGDGSIENPFIIETAA